MMAVSGDQQSLDDLEASVRRVLEATVQTARALYIKERDARRPADHLWNAYARDLHRLRIHMRSLNHE